MNLEAVSDALPLGVGLAQHERNQPQVQLADVPIQPSDLQAAHSGALVISREVNHVAAVEVFDVWAAVEVFDVWAAEPSDSG